MIQKLIIELQRILDRSCIAGRIKSKDPARPWSSPPGGLGAVAVGDGEASENDDLAEGEAAETKGLGDGGAVEDDDVTADEKLGEEDVDVAAVFIIMLCFIYCFYLT